MYDIAIIGAGIIGSFIARELARYKLNIIVLEKENDVANGTTMANSGIVFDAYHSKPDLMKGTLIPRGNELFDEVCEELDVLFKRVGSLVIGFNDEDKEKINKLYKKGLANKVPGIRILNGEEVLKMEPNLNPNIKFALYSPTCGIVSPFELSIALMENAIENGVELLLNSEVISIEKNANFKVILKNNEIEAKYVINCAGINADKINNMIAAPSFKTVPKRGQYLVLDKAAGGMVNSVIQQCKVNNEKGILLIPTIHNNIMLGPSLEEVEDREALDTTIDMLDNIRNKAIKICEDIPLNSVIRSFSGLKAKVGSGDFIIEESKEIKGFINVAGIASPGLTCSPAIAEKVVGIIMDIFHRNNEEITVNNNFNSKRRKTIRFKSLSEEEKISLIKRNPKYGTVVCRCETITEGEIIDAINRKAGATTVKGVKKRTGASLGRCQGGFCEPKIVAILARELKKEMHEILYDNEGSYILTEREEM